MFGFDRVPIRDREWPDDCRAAACEILNQLASGEKQRHHVVAATQSHRDIVCEDWRSGPRRLMTDEQDGFQIGVETPKREGELRSHADGTPSFQLTIRDIVAETVHPGG